MISLSIIKNNLEDVMERIERAKERAGRKDSVTLIAVTKTFPKDVLQMAVEAGVTHFGENYVQEALEKIPAAPEATWHFIGSLQRNKAKFIPGNFQFVHSIDSFKLADELEKRAKGKKEKVKVLIQVNIAGEGTKAGVQPEGTEELAIHLLKKENLILKGLMVIPPIPEKPEDSRKWFIKLREIRDRLVEKGIPRDNLQELSMGMSDDFEIAVEEGATMVRVGRKIFGERGKK